MVEYILFWMEKLDRITSELGVDRYGTVECRGSLQSRSFFGIEFGDSSIGECSQIQGPRSQHASVGS